jgi:hypothetical protein
VHHQRDLPASPLLGSECRPHRRRRGDLLGRPGSSRQGTRPRGAALERQGELGNKVDPNAPIRNPYKDLLRYDAKRKAKQAIQSLKNGDSLVIGFHANPRGFQDGSEFVEWKDFWSHFGIDRTKAPRLKSVVVCGCMLNMAGGVLGSVINISVDENGVNHIKNSFNADTAFVPKTTYDTGSLQDVTIGSIGAVSARLPLAS